MTRSIAYRRHHRQRVLDRANKVIRYVWGHPWKLAYKYADDLCKCSCEFCQPGSSGRQVKRADAAMAYQLSQLNQLMEG